VLRERYLAPAVDEDLTEKMVFIGGPRQVGKTTFAKRLGMRCGSSHYINWDVAGDRKAFRQQTWPGDTDLLILDEIHKLRTWKRVVKGIYDHHAPALKILVTGSARLDIFRRGGDSLQGRYHYFRMHPFSLAETLLRASAMPDVLAPLEFPRHAGSRDGFASLLRFGGFPEPFTRQSARTHRRWQLERCERLVREDIRETENIRDLALLENMAAMLPERVGSLLSLNALREELEVAHRTIAQWTEILERFYFHFRVYPFQARTFRALKKEPKLYMWDWSLVNNPAARLENVVASHLLKFTHWLTDREGYRAELWFLRDRDQREVDFLVTVDKKPWFAVEVKSDDVQPAKALFYFGERIRIPHLYQVTTRPDVDEMRNGVRVMSVERFLLALV
jgi:predicted AAA+ superfamily ATPase